MCQCDRIRHVFFGFVCCKTEHHTLVTCTDCLNLIIGHLVFFCFQCFVYAHSDIAGLLIDCCDHTAGISIKAIFSSGVSDLTDRISYDFLDINVCFCGDLTHNQYQTGCCCCLACYTAHRILLKQCVQNRIRNRVAHFVRMSFCYRLGCK